MIDRRLTVLRTFASCGTVAATADLTGYSPSAVSAQLREFQRSLGMTLLVKDGRGLRLTETGREMVRQSDLLVSTWERIRAQALVDGGQFRSEIGLGGFSTAAANLLAPLAASVRRDNPSVTVRIVEASPARCFDLLVAEKLDLAVVISMQAEGFPSERFDRFPLLDDPLDVVVPADHPMAGRGSVALAELEDEDWITDAPGRPYHALFTAAFTAVGVSPRITHEVSEWDTMIALIATGTGMGLVPRLADLHGAAGVARIPLDGPGTPVRRVLAAVRRGSGEDPLLRHCLELLRRSAQEIMDRRVAGGPPGPSNPQNPQDA